MLYPNLLVNLGVWMWWKKYHAAHQNY